MADDVENTEEETEQTPDASDFSKAFGDAVVGDDETETKADDKTEEVKAEEAKQKIADDEVAKVEADEKSAADAKEKEDGKGADDDKSGDDKDKNLDADGKEIEVSEEDKAAEERGKKLIEEEDKAKEEADKKAEEDKQKAADDQAAKDADKVNPVTEAQIKTFVGLIPPSELPDTIEIDGTDYDVKEYLDDNPEAQVVSGLVTQRILERLVDNGVLMTAEKHNEVITELEDRLYGLHFDTTVYREHPDADEITASEKFKTWMEKTATKADLALLGSRDPKDYILGLKKFKGVAPPASDKSKAEAAKKAKDKKDEHDSIHSKSMGATHKNNDASGGGEGSSEFGDAFKEAEAEAEKKK